VLFRSKNTSFSDQRVIYSESAIAYHQKYTILKINPFRKSLDGNFEKLDSIFIQIKKSIVNTTSTNRTSTSNSVLANGNWAKISTYENGVYKVDYNFIKQSGLIEGEVNISDIKLFGNGGGMLPLSNNDFRWDDLQENAIRVFDLDNNGLFNNGDYFIFYGTSQSTWKWVANDKKYTHSKNLFSDSTYYFLTINNNGPGKRIQDLPNLNGIPATRTVDQFIDCAFHEKDDYNFIKSGRNWYGDAFDVDLNQSFAFNFPNIQPGAVKFTSAVISRTSTSMATPLARGAHLAVLVLVLPCLQSLSARSLA
jgi:hypothetical protein